jgi:hypothetical protein
MFKILRAKFDFIMIDECFLFLNMALFCVGFNFTYPVASPIKNLVRDSIVGDGMRVASRDVIDRNGHVDLQRHVFSAFPPKRALVVAAPRVHGAVRGQRHSVHASANYFYDLASWHARAYVEQ